MVAATGVLRFRERVKSYLLHPRNLVVYADKSIVVLNKPNGLHTQPMMPLKSRASERNSDPFITVLQGIQGDLLPVHRLDKPTTGTLVLARTIRAARDISAQLAHRTAKKTYFALVCGDASHFPSPKGTIKTDLECINGQVNVKGTPNPLPPRAGHGESWVKHAITDYEVLSSSTKVPLSILKLDILTGCKHQIRVQLAQHFAPILSDSIYGSPDRDAPVKSLLGQKYTPFLYLHSSRFSFTRYRAVGPGKAFQFTVGAPLSVPFQDVCAAAGMHLGMDAIAGGVWINGTKVWGPEPSLDQTTKPVTDIIGDKSSGVAMIAEELQGVWYGPTISDE
ncbi:pseudouridine synthase [Trametes coccinea BRFM310]|uniref:21S rRNA pseudouridine(2819) synthase n=1 Tax=Trametes coccinea (strain BRFM310) TaxID=1353009 RepID=A0A1Y2IT41_TRAC3|nr:pseudouridine synthase [Trametes coccinea BRFM310]